MNISLHDCLYAFVTISSWYVSKKLKTVSTQTPKVVSICCIPYPRLTKSESKKCLRLCPKCASMVHSQIKIMLYIPHHIVENLSIVHTLFLKEDEIQNLIVPSKL